MRSTNDEGSQFSKLHSPCNKEERLVLNPFFREYKPLSQKTLNLFNGAYHPVSCLLHLHIHKYIDRGVDRDRHVLFPRFL